jgi:hypothetical protein
MTLSSPASPHDIADVHTPGMASLIFGVMYPAAVVVIELVSGICARSLFDPMPTAWHVLAVCGVPASNLLLVLHLRDRRPWSARWVAFANGGAIAVAAFYALLFLPLSWRNAADAPRHVPDSEVRKHSPRLLSGLRKAIKRTPCHKSAPTGCRYRWLRQAAAALGLLAYSVDQRTPRGRRRAAK